MKKIFMFAALSSPIMIIILIIINTNIRSMNRKEEINLDINVDEIIYSTLEECEKNERIENANLNKQFEPWLNVRTQDDMTNLAAIDQSEYKIEGKTYQCNETSEIHNYDSIKDYGIYESVFYDKVSEEYFDIYSDSEVEDFDSLEWSYVIPLEYLESHTIDKWDDLQKQQYGTDPTVGIVTLKSNIKKRNGGGPSKWLPEYGKESYCFSWLFLAKRFNLAIDKSDLKTIKETLKRTNYDEVGLLNPFFKLNEPKEEKK